KKALEVLKYGDQEHLYDVVRYFDNTSRRQKTTFDGIINMMQSRYEQNPNMYEYYEQFMIDEPCPECHGARLNPAILGVTVGGKNIDQFCRMSVTEAVEFVAGLDFTESEWTIAREIIKEIKARLSFLESVGLEYLTLSRTAGTLSGGEAQRIRLATQIGSALMGVLYVLDEPSIGLHQRDNDKLIATL
ncbi:MAG: excinuclease ABC subunit UvrA, partial [Lachnospiraceae bacterium]|nr:excinuclease ABC subunit UvrA [Lachnospiraceae bacterium]